MDAGRSTNHRLSTRSGLPRRVTPDTFSTTRLTSAIPGREVDAPPPASGRPVIGILPGEGIGPEVMEAAVEVLGAAAARAGVEFDLRYGGAIGTAAEKAYGRALTPEVIRFCESVFADGGAVLCGAGGGRFVYDLRARFDLYCKLTPIRPMPALADAGAVRSATRDGVDILVVRENAGGAYFGQWSRGETADGGTEARHAFRYRADEVHRILAAARELARRRRGRLALVVKPSGMPAVSELWTELFEELVAGEWLETRILEVDNACYQLVASAQEFDVVVAPNLFGDILSDVAALLLGSRGLSYSGNFGAPGTAVYQTGHGAARDLAGRGIANPAGQILSAALLLRESFGLMDAAAAIEAAVEATFASGLRTADVAVPGCRVVGTRELGRAVAESVLLSRKEMPVAS